MLCAVEMASATCSAVIVMVDATKYASLLAVPHWNGSSVLLFWQICAVECVDPLGSAL